MKKTVLILSFIVVLVVTFVVFNQLKKDKNKEEEAYSVTNLAELFPTEKMTQKFKDANGEYEVAVSKPNSLNGLTTITTSYDVKDENDETITVEMTYVITNEKVIESGEYISNGKVVSVIYPTELIVGVPYLNMTWKSVDGLVTNTVVNMVNNKVTIESIREIDTYEENETAPIKKEFKETRIYEKGKGIVLYRSEIVGDETSVAEKKLVD